MSGARKLADLRLAGTGDVARHLGVSPQRVDQLDRSGQLPHAVRTMGGQRLWDFDEVQTFARSRPPTAAPRGGVK